VPADPDPEVALDPAIWEAHAAWWQEGFTEGADPEYAEQILPLAAEHLAGARRILDLGCGEGQIARLAADPAGKVAADVVVGLDPATAQLEAARRRGGGPSYARGRAERLPFADGSFDATVACLVLEHTPDLDAALAEVARVLVPGGRFVLLANHPLFQTPGSGWIDDQILDPPEQYWRIGPYLPERVTLEEVDAGVTLPFFHRPLGRYVNALAAQGLLVTAMVEPAPPPGFLALGQEYADAATVPRLVLLHTARR
jgi:SAM-dependent methyltransferase